MIKRGDALRGWLTRPGVLLVWALVFWGTLLAGTAGFEALGEGAPGAWKRLWPAYGDSLWAWLNAACVVLAAAAWLLLGALVLWSRLARPEATPAD